ncbi:MAG: ATP-binding protein, partial [Rhodocyclaceae bacterium]|nr:ATP-binding protein [Rhodocyclaceae bacterium]
LSELLRLEFIAEASNVFLVGPSGLGKTTLAQNIAYEAVLHGHTVLFASAGQEQTAKKEEHRRTRKKDQNGLLEKIHRRKSTKKIRRLQPAQFSRDSGCR